MPSVTENSSLYSDSPGANLRSLSPRKSDGAGRSRRSRNTWKKTLQKILDLTSVNVIMTTVTIYALFGEDLRTAVFNKSSDNVFYAFSSVAFALFVIELAMQSYCRKDYLCGFYFWLDFASTASLVADIGWLFNSQIQTSNSNSSAAAQSAIQAGRASRVATRAGRIVRIVRIIRLLKVAKFISAKKEEAERRRVSTKPMTSINLDDETVNDDQEVEEVVVVQAEPSQIGKVLSETLTVRLVVLVLVFLVASPFFQSDFYDAEAGVNFYQGHGIDVLHRLPQDWNVSNDIFFETVQDYIQNAGFILYAEICHKSKSNCLNGIQQDYLYNIISSTQFTDLTTGVVSYTDTNTGWTYNNIFSSYADVVEKYRIDELTIAISTGCYDVNSVFINSSCTSQAIFSLKAANQATSILNIIKTFFVILLLVIGSILFTRDAETLVILPIERMVNLIKKLAENPLAQATVEKDEDEQQGGYEIKLLESTLEKIGMLLQVGFGVAGDAIIGNNIAGGGALNPMIPGRKIFSIFGFCDIRYFVNATECLQEDIMVFVNKVAFIVHGCVHLYGGAANKNIGEAWLLVWKLPKSTTDEILAVVQKRIPGEAKKETTGANLRKNSDDSTNNPQSKPPTPQNIQNRRLSTGLMSPPSGPLSPTPPSSNDKEEIINTRSRRASVSSSPHLGLTDIVIQLADNALTSFLKVIVDVNNSIKNGSLEEYSNHPELVKLNWKITMGFGLHVGWAIEGAIGSIHKIDASYLSPHVNMASRLEAATKQYGVKFLCSHFFFRLLSPASQRYCRKVDCVTVKGSAVPIELYTFDTWNISSTSIGSDDDLRVRRGHPPFRVVTMETDKSIEMLQGGVDVRFKPTFQEGIDAYINGKWKVASTLLLEAQKMLPNDGPCKTILEVMGEEKFVAPESWKGFRPLTSK